MKTDINWDPSTLNGIYRMVYDVKSGWKSDDINKLLDKFSYLINKISYAVANKYRVPMDQVVEDTKSHFLELVNSYDITYQSGINVDGWRLPYFGNYIRLNLYGRVVHFTGKHSNKELNADEGLLDNVARYNNMKDFLTEDLSHIFETNLSPAHSSVYVYYYINNYSKSDIMNTMNLKLVELNNIIKDIQEYVKTNSATILGDI